MILIIRHGLGWLTGALRSREDLILENLALRQQLLALHAKRQPANSSPGKHTVVFDFKYDGPGFGKGGSGVLSVDETFDVGSHSALHRFQ